MILNFKYGFTYKELNFGWKDKVLYRLPSFTKMKSYPLKKLDLISIGNKKGYRVNRDKKTIKQLMEITEKIDYTYCVNGVNSDDCPF